MKYEDRPWPPEWRIAYDAARASFGRLMADLLAEGHQFELSFGAQKLLLRVLTVLEKRKSPQHQYDTCATHGVAERVLSAWKRACQGYEFSLALTKQAEARLVNHVAFLFTATGMQVNAEKLEQDLFRVLGLPDDRDWEQKGDADGSHP